jgi:predicted nucleic acid-binding Zn ribbon protein
MPAAVELVRQCAACGGSAESSCTRCGLPVCPAHRPARDRRCGECEASFRRRRPARLLTYVVALVLTSVALVVALFFLILATGGGALGVAPLILFGSFPIILHRLEFRARSRFLAERRQVALPTARLLR